MNTAKRLKHCKGQMVFEFIVASILFISIVFYIIITVNAQVSSYTSNYYRNHIQEESMRVAEMLTHNKGIWEYNSTISLYEPRSVGLAAEWPIMNDTQIDYLSEYCNSDQERMVQILDLGGRASLQGGTINEYYKILISNSTDNIVDCGGRTVTNDQAYAERIAFSKISGLVKVSVYVW